MKHQRLYARKNKKNIIKLSFGDSAQRVIKMNFLQGLTHQEWIIYLSSDIWPNIRHLPNQNTSLKKKNNQSHIKEFTDSYIFKKVFVCVEVLRPSQPSGVMSSAISLPNHTFTGHA